MSDLSIAQTQAPPTPFFIGVDLSLTSTGVAVIHGDSITLHRVETKGTKADTTATTAARLRHILNEVMAHVPLSDWTYVVIEGPAYGVNNPGTHVRDGLWWMLRAELYLEGVHVLVAPPSVVKKYATGSGNAGKDKVLAAVIRRYSWVDVTGNDEADALVLAAIGARFHGYPVEESLPKAQAEVTEKVTR